jgi:hypothetical protein
MPPRPTRSSRDLDLDHQREEPSTKPRTASRPRCKQRTAAHSGNPSSSACRLSGRLGNHQVAGVSHRGDRRHEQQQHHRLLLRRVFAEGILQCACGGHRTVVAFVADANLARSLLTALGLPAEPPRLRPPAPHPGQARLARPRVAPRSPAQPPIGQPSAWTRLPVRRRTVGSLTLRCPLYLLAVQELHTSSVEQWGSSLRTPHRESPFSPLCFELPGEDPHLGGAAVVHVQWGVAP